VAEARENQTHKLSKAQRAQLIGWMAAGITGYGEIKRLLIQHGFPVINRQAVNYYRQTYGARPRCSKCGREFPPVAVKEGEPI
jgi:hypothetical protein